MQYYTTFFSDHELYVSREYSSDAIVDKVGSGDCYMAGLIRGLYLGQPVAEMVEFATAAAFFTNFSSQADATDQPAEDIEKFMLTHGKP